VNDTPLTCAFTVLVDTREQLPFTFADLRSDARDGRRPLVVPTRIETLTTGDYSLDGSTDKIAIERKSCSDLLHSLGHDRDRFSGCSNDTGRTTKDKTAPGRPQERSSDGKH
jgi:ERCC4-type nuclease